MAVSSGADAEHHGQYEHLGKRAADKFDPAAPPPFKIADIRAAIPPHCWVKDPFRSLSYVAWDVFVVAALFAAAAYFDSWIFWPIYWAAQGTMFWALFVLGHDCGHGSFSDNTTLNNVVGHVLHSSILVPYHGWRISHRTHHQNHGHVENDESWVPLTENLYKQLDFSTKFLRYKIPFPMFAYPLYLWYRSPGKSGSHFNPYSSLFKPNERDLVITSTICWAAMLASLLYASTIVGPTMFFNLYGVPYLVDIRCVAGHGYISASPWLRQETPLEWSYLRGGLTTVDQDYGIFNKIHHDIGTHVVHHLFPQIPHYHLVEATREAKRVLGDYYREPRKSGAVPFHLVPTLLKSLSRDHYVSDNGDIVYYQTDGELFSSKEI
ncbi:hypothetical protein SASPL_135803 [Salvia splendens]|uniref:Omega-3 fatty acid desaturase (Delta-15 desaturase) n=1 Tax=Salvia splendens TaxID=180675 RepID=A0A8X8ZG32_SALSN|nr:hypothetical protein SASPL_135803 [Salvia splendens]